MVDSQRNSVDRPNMLSIIFIALQWWGCLFPSQRYMENTESFWLMPHNMFPVRWYSVCTQGHSRHSYAAANVPFQATCSLCWRCSCGDLEHRGELVTLQEILVLQRKDSPCLYIISLSVGSKEWWMNSHQLDLNLGLANKTTLKYFHVP